MENTRESAKARPSRADDQPPASPTAAAAQLQRLLEYASEHDEHLYMVLRLGLSSIRAYAKASKDTGTIDKIANVRHRALEKLATDDDRRVSVLNDLAQDFLAKFEVSNLKTDIETCLHLFHDAASSSTLLLDEHRWHGIHNIGTALMERYRAFGASSDLHLAIEKLKQALALASEDGPVRIVQLRALGLTYIHKYAESHAQEDFESAKATLQAIIDMGPLSVEHHAQVLFDLSSLHLCDFRNSVTTRCQEAPIPTSLVENDSTAHGPSHAKRRKDHQLAIVDEMIRLIRASLQKPSTKYSHLERLNQLSVTYLYRYKLTGAEVDRKTSDSIAQNALSMALEGKLDHLKLQAAVENIERVIEGSQLTKPRFDLELGKLYIIKYDRLGCPTDLETGHSLLQRGLRKATSSSVRRELLIVLGGMVHLRRFAADGSSADIEAAIEMFEEALQISSEADRSGVMLLPGLGSAYLSRYSRTKSPQDFNTGMTTLENAHKAALEADLLVDDALSHLADAHAVLYQKEKDLASINRAIELAEEAFVIGIESIDKLNRLECLSQYYLFRYEQTNDQSDLQAALRRLREVVEQIPGDHPDRAWYFQRYTALLNVSGGNEIGHTETDSLTLLEEALDHGPSRPVQRILAGRRLAKQYIVEGAWKLAYRALERTMALVPLLTPNFLRNDDKKSVISPIAGLATDAAVVALRAGKSPYEAVNLIELGRGIIQSSLTSMRTNVSKLEEAHPKLAQTFVRSRDLLDTPWLPQEPPSHADSRPLAPGQHPNVRYAAHRELQRTIQEIRNLDGLRARSKLQRPPAQ